MKPSHVLAVGAWTSVFVLSWLMIVDAVPLRPIQGWMWIFFVLIALGASGSVKPTHTEDAQDEQS